MERVKVSPYSEIYGVDIPKLPDELRDYLVSVDGETRLRSLYNPGDGLEDPHPGWIRLRSKLKPDEKALIHSVISSLLSCGYDTVSSIRQDSVEQMIERSRNSENRYQLISSGRAIIVKYIFQETPTENNLQLSAISN